MSTIASQLTRILAVCSTVCSAHIIENIKRPRHMPLWGESAGDRWIPLTNGQWRKIFSFDDVIMLLMYSWPVCLGLDPWAFCSDCSASDCRSMAPFQYPKRRVIVSSREVSKPRDLYLKSSDRSDIWQASPQHCCRCACQISKRHDDLNYRSRGFETLRDLTRLLVVKCCNRFRCIFIPWCLCWSSFSSDLTHLPVDKMAAIWQTIFLDAFLWMKNFVV